MQYDHSKADEMGLVDDSEISRIVHEVNAKGISYLPNFLNPSALEAMQKFVKLIVAANGDEYLSLTSAELSDTLLGALARSDAFIDVMQTVYKKGCNDLLPQQAFYQVLRCLKGQTGLKHTHIFFIMTFIY